MLFGRSQAAGVGQRRSQLGAGGGRGAEVGCDWGGDPPGVSMTAGGEPPFYTYPSFGGVRAWGWQGEQGGGVTVSCHPLPPTLGVLPGAGECVPLQSPALLGWFRGGEGQAPSAAPNKGSSLLPTVSLVCLNVPHCSPGARITSLRWAGPPRGGKPHRGDDLLNPAQGQDPSSPPFSCPRRGSLPVVWGSAGAGD